MRVTYAALCNMHQGKQEWPQIAVIEHMARRRSGTATLRRSRRRALLMQLSCMIASFCWSSRSLLCLSQARSSSFPVYMEFPSASCFAGFNFGLKLSFLGPSDFDVDFSPLSVVEPSSLPSCHPRIKCSLHRTPPKPHSRSSQWVEQLNPREADTDMNTQGVVWGGVTISSFFVAFRAYARWKSFRRYFWDDGFVLFAWILILATAIMWHFVAADLFQISYVASGKLSITHTPTLVQDTELYLRVSIAVIIFFYTSLWAIKFSFLIFFRKLTAGTYIKAQIIQWWVVFGFTLVTWFACLGTLEYNCLAAPLPRIAQHCSDPYAVRFQRVTLIFNCAMDVLTDIMSSNFSWGPLGETC